MATETTNDPVNEYGCRGRTAVDPTVYVYSVVESIDPQYKDSFFETEIRLIIELADGRTLSRTFNLEFEADDILEEN